MNLIRSPFGPRATLSCLITLMRSSSQRKHVGRWITSLRRGYLLDAPLPWIAFDAIDFITAHLPPNPRVFEYGSGGSTLYWLSRGADCVSIEHDPEWFEVVRKRAGTTDKLDYRLVLPEKGPDTDMPVDAADPTNYASADKHFRGFNFRQYVKQIDELPDEYFDLILIDGRCRPACLVHSHTKIKRDGMIVLDNADLAYYTFGVQHILHQFTEQRFEGAIPNSTQISRTSVYFVK